LNAYNDIFCLLGRWTISNCGRGCPIFAATDAQNIGRFKAMLNKQESLHRKIAELEAENNRLKKALQQSEEWFRKIFHASSNMMAIHTIREGRFVDVNEAAASLGGFKREDLIGHTMAERNLLDDPHLQQMTARKLKEEGRVHNVELKLRGKRGDTRTVLASLDTITINNEPCMLAVSVDITEREEKADALRRSEEKYRMLVENSLQGLTIIQNKRIVFCNTKFAAMSGYSVEELLSLSPGEIESMTHPEDQTAVRERYHDQLEGKSIDPRAEYQGIKKDGTTFWVEVHTSVIDYDGMPAIQSVFMDITERKNAENALRESQEYLNQIINCIGDPIFVKDREHRFVHVNDALCAFGGMAREKLIGRIDQPNASMPFWEQEEQVFETGKEILSEDNFTDGQGAPCTLMTKKSLLIDKSGNKQVVGVLRDITEYKRLEAQFLQSQKMEAVGVLAGGVAHDFNNLLNVINGYAELMLEDIAPDGPMRKDLERIREAGQRATALTSQLLAFSRKQILQPEILDLNHVIADMRSMLQRIIGEDIELVSGVQADQTLINADHSKIQQVIMNLVVNARDAMPLGGKLTIETANCNFDESYVKDHPMAKPGPYVMLAISDNGIGMDPTTQERIFEPFFTTKEKGKGTGLGLSTVYGIVKQSDGFVWVYSEPGKGTTIKIYFPRVLDAIPASYSENKMESEFRGSETVLVVEDEEAVRSLACRVLRNRGYDVIEAADGMEALRIAQDYQQVIHLVISDVVMPGMGGRALVSQLEQVRPGIKALYVSGYTDNAIVHHGILDSDVAFLQKPFTVDALIRKAREVLLS
jgi:two-component system, cell cycle sensor histidine kinase and response regulator CckA